MNSPLMPPSRMMKIVEGRGSETHTKHFGNYCALINVEEKNPFFDALDHCYFIAAVVTVIVGFRVLNKTTEEYWFLTKFNFSRVQVEGNMEIGRITSSTEYFLVRLLTHSRLKFTIDTFNI